LQKLLYVDDHPLFCEGLSRALAAEIPGLRIEIASSVVEALKRLESEPDGFDLCLSDRRLGDGEGAQFAAMVRERFPSVAAGVLTGDVTPGLCRRLRAAGAVACLSKERSVVSLGAAVRRLLDGGKVFEEAQGSDFATITARRREIIELAAAGLLDKQIGAQLEISESTVRNHWRHIFERLGASNRTQAVSKALRRGLI
jgi:DNA-binding NarL/FixJ family response regulator